jgi:hypothetical protein
MRDVSEFIHSLSMASLLLAAGCSDSRRRDATEDEVRSVASKCGAVVNHVRHSADKRDDGPSLTELGIPTISVTIDTRTRAEFSFIANCIDRELHALGAYSRIYGPNGEDLLVSSGIDRIT